MTGFARWRRRGAACAGAPVVELVETSGGRLSALGAAAVGAAPMGDYLPGRPAMVAPIFSPSLRAAISQCSGFTIPITLYPSIAAALAEP